MKQLGGAAPAPRPDRAASAVLHDEPNARIVAFLLTPGQSVPPHTSTSTVIVHVVADTGEFTGGEATLRASAGDTIVYAPAELHGFVNTGDSDLHLLALIAPRPGG